MAYTKISSGDYTNQRNIDFTNTDMYSDQEFSCQIPAAPSTSQNEYQMDWNRWNGYYHRVTEFAALLDKKALWTVGKGVITDANTTKILERIRGNGKSTFNQIMDNAVKTYSLAGDFYAERVATRRGKLTNLKPLNPGTIKIIASDKGIIKRYEQFTELGSKPANKFKPEEMLHLMWNPMADAIHGLGSAEKLERVLLMREESMSDLKTIFHRYVKPLLIISVDTDDTAEITAFKKKVDKAMENSENLIVPKDTVDHIEKVSIPQFSTLDPLPWIKFLEQQFVICEGVPLIIAGVGDDTTEATSKILYLAWQQVVEWNQLFLEQQLKNQLGLKVKFKFPVSIEQLLQRDQDKAGKESKLKPKEDGAVKV